MPATKLNDSNETILITGGTGLVGSELSRILKAGGYTVIHLSRNPSQKTYRTFYWDVKKRKIEDEAIISADAIIHLAGAGVLDKRWNDLRKKEIYDSRIDSTRLLRERVEKLNPKLKYFLSASAIGYYGWDTGNKIVDEEVGKGEGFLADVVQDWELEANKFSELGIKNGKVRIGIVLSEKGGALIEMAKPIRFGVGAPLGSGDQYMSWIHLEDLCGIFIHMLETKEDAIVNGVSPQPVSNKEFTSELAIHLKKPLWVPNVPKFVLRLLVGEIAGLLVGGNRVSSRKLEKAGFKFQFPTLKEAIQDLL